MKLGLSKAKSPDRFDYVLLGLLLLMMVSSLLSICAAFGIVGQSAGIGFILRQLMWYAIGFGLIAVLRYLGNDSLLQFAKIGYWILMGCLLLLWIGHIYNKYSGSPTNQTFLGFIATTNGATSWFNLPGLGTFQPSEFMKIVLVILTAGIIDEHNQNKLVDSFEMDFKLFLEVGKWAFPPMVLILMQPDTGVCIIIGISLLVMLLCSGIRREWIIVIAVLLAVFVTLFAYLYVFQYDLLVSLVGGDEYKLSRINGWLHPEDNTRTDSYQLYLSLMVVGSAGLTGHGMGLDLVAIPEAQTDFIFAVIGQSWGLLGMAVIVVLCALLDLHLCRIAANCKNMMDKYFILGVLGILIYQQIQNMGMIIGLLPITGITLPLISYGGSSLLSYMICFGIIFNISSRSKQSKQSIFE